MMNTQKKSTFHHPDTIWCLLASHLHTKSVYFNINIVNYPQNYLNCLGICTD